MCGFVGITGVPNVGNAVCFALQALQHRGQDAAGLGTYDSGRLHLYKDLGMVSQALPEAVVNNTPGTSGIGHVRYPTHGTSTREDAQPFMTRKPGILLAHNGNIINVPELEAQLLERGFHLLSQCDSEPILLVLADELSKLRPANHTTEDLVEALGHLMKRIRGSYSVVALMEIDGRETMLAFRDPHGIRPISYGQHANGPWMVASESVALDVLDFRRKGHVDAGHMVLFRSGEAPIVRAIRPRKKTHCIFEQIYFARPDSVMERGRVYQTRWSLGERLAEEWKKKGLSADVVVAVPDTSRPAAQGMAEALGLPFREGFIKNRYTGRTFIMPDQASRESAIRLKLNPIEEVFEGKHVLLVDDSIVRGTTMRRIISLLRKLNPASIHVAIFSPPVRHPCFYGIDMPSKKELVASEAKNIVSVESMLREHLSADSMTYLSVEGLAAVGGKDICSACFTGQYIVPLSVDEEQMIVKERRPE